ncbi:MAG: 50S ribosomal protein L31 [Acidobacteria bacterium]|nr:MAG: 50S ribosomal protein L31 [Acidobacteriota bacterium]
MKAAIHPAYNEIRVMCACGNSFSTRSTHKGDIHVEEVIDSVICKHQPSHRRGLSFCRLLIRGLPGSRL